MPNPVVHFEIVGKNQDLLESFYKDVFAWQITPVMKGYSMVAKEEGGIGGGIGGFADTPNYVTIYVEVADIVATLASIVEHGGKKIMGPHPIPDGSGLIGIITDPEEHVIGLIQRTPKS